VQLHELRTEALVDELRHPDRRLRRVEGEQECHRLGDHERLTDGGGVGVGWVRMRPLAARGGKKEKVDCTLVDGRGNGDNDSLRSARQCNTPCYENLN
jgi:hypothetical protein